MPNMTTNVTEHHASDGATAHPELLVGEALIALAMPFFASYLGGSISHLTVGFYITSLLEDVGAVVLLNEDTHATSLLFLTFLAFPFMDFYLKEAAAAFTPDHLLDDLVISLGLEVAQAYLFSYFADFSAPALAFFTFILALQIWGILAIFRITEPPDPDTVTLGGAAIVEPCCAGCVGLVQGVSSHGLAFTAGLFCMASLQGVWEAFDVDVPFWADVSVTFIAWLLGTWPTFSALAADPNEALFDIDNVANLSFYGNVGTLAVLVMTEYVLINHWQELVAAKGLFLASLGYVVYMNIVCGLVTKAFIGMVAERDTLVDTEGQPGTVALHGVAADGVKYYERLMGALGAFLFGVVHTVFATGLSFASLVFLPILLCFQVPMCIMWLETTPEGVFYREPPRTQVSKAGGQSKSDEDKNKELI